MKKPMKNYPVTCYFFPEHRFPSSSLHQQVVKPLFDGSVGGALGGGGSDLRCENTLKF